MSNIAAKTIQTWWKQNTSTTQLRSVYNILKTDLTPCDLQELSNHLCAINAKCKGDGAGLSSSGLIDMYLSEYFQKKITDYEEFHKGESDMKIHGVEISLKTIGGGKSSAALDWSKNSATSIEKTHFNSHVMILNRTTKQWWKSKPTKITNTNSCATSISYNDTIKSGIYLVDKQFCKKYIQLSSNNKTNTLIDSQNLYLMIKKSVNQNLFIEIPEPNETLNFSVMGAFNK